MKPQVFVVNFDHPLHTIPPSAQPPAGLPTIFRLLSCDDSRVAAPVLNNLVDAAHIGGHPGHGSALCAPTRTLQAALLAPMPTAWMQTVLAFCGSYGHNM